MRVRKENGSVNAPHGGLPKPEKNPRAILGVRQKRIRGKGETAEGKGPTCGVAEAIPLSGDDLTNE